MYKPGWKPGRWSGICDTCGFRFHSDKLFKRWDGLYVCKDDLESKHPQLFIRGVSEKITPPWTRPEQTDTFSNICYLWERSCYADLATADCALADNTQFTYAFLLGLRDPSAAE